MSAFDSVPDCRWCGAESEPVGCSFCGCTALQPRCPCDGIAERPIIYVRVDGHLYNACREDCAQDLEGMRAEIKDWNER